MAHFWSGGHSGPSSVHYRTKRDATRKLLDEENSTRIREWLEEYIEWLSRDIERAEIEEEREL